MEVQGRVQQQTDYRQVGLFPIGWSPPRQSPVTADLQPTLRNGHACRPFAGSGSEDRSVALHLMLRLFLAFVVSPLLLLAEETGSITGRVVESGGGTLTGVKVTLVNQETSTKQEVVTAEDGRFSFRDLKQGMYLLQIVASGFKPYKANIRVTTEKLNPLRVKLKLETVEEEVIVRPDTTDDRLSPESNVPSMKVDETFFSDLPLDVDYLLPFINTFTSAAARGQEGTSIVVDGVDGGELDMPSSAIRSVKVNRNPYSAEFQHPGAARAEITTKHGHGHRYRGSVARPPRPGSEDLAGAPQQ
jgi:carboxypeptidase family protein